MTQHLRRMNWTVRLGGEAAHSPFLVEVCLVWRGTSSRKQCSQSAKPPALSVGLVTVCSAGCDIVLSRSACRAGSSRAVCMHAVVSACTLDLKRYLVSVGSSSSPAGLTSLSTPSPHSAPSLPWLPSGIACRYSQRPRSTKPSRSFASPLAVTLLNPPSKEISTSFTHFLVLGPTALVSTAVSLRVLHCQASS